MKLASRTIAALTILAIIAWPVSCVRTLECSVDRLALGVDSGVLVVRIATNPLFMSCTAEELGYSPAWLRPPPRARWRPAYSGISLDSFGMTTLPSMVASQFFVPLYLWILLGFALLCTPQVLRIARRRRGCCIHCNYNLTGNLSGVCPECGQGIK